MIQAYCPCDGLHSCHDECPRVACELRRHLTTAKARIEKLEGALREICQTPEGHKILDVSRNFAQSKYRHHLNVASEALKP